MLILAVLLLQAGVTYVQLRQTSEVTTQDALAEFRKRVASADVPSPSLTPTGGDAASAPGAAGVPAVGATVASSPKPSPTATCDWACFASVGPPEFGVYEYWQCDRPEGGCGATSAPGFEKIGGIRRNFPLTGQRIISPGSSGKFNNLHLYAQDSDGRPLHQEEFEMAVNEKGVFNHRYKVDITIGGHTETTDIIQQPYLQFISLPLSVGKSWSGEWKDANGYADARYTSTVTGKEELTIGGKKVRTWVVEAKMTLLGPKNRGEVKVVVWVAPEYRQTVQEHYDQKITNEQGIAYEGFWTVTLKNLQPSR